MGQNTRSPFDSRTENEDTVETLGDLIHTRENPTQENATVAEMRDDDDDLDIEKALTFPQKKSTTRNYDNQYGTTAGFDADARTETPADDADDASYMTRADLVESMLETDPDPNVGANSRDFIGDAGLDRAPDITGTVTGIGRGMATHLPQDIGSDGFEIEEPEMAGDPNLDPLQVTDDADDMADPSMSRYPMDADEALLEDDLRSDGGRMPVRQPDVDSRDEALDATRRIE